MEGDLVLAPKAHELAPIWESYVPSVRGAVMTGMPRTSWQSRGESHPVLWGHGASHQGSVSGGLRVVRRPGCSFILSWWCGGVVCVLRRMAWLSIPSEQVCTRAASETCMGQGLCPLERPAWAFILALSLTASPRKPLDSLSLSRWG